MRCQTIAERERERERERRKVMVEKYSEKGYQIFDSDTAYA